MNESIVGTLEWLTQCQEDGELRLLLGSLTTEFNLTVGGLKWHWLLSRDKITVEESLGTEDFHVIIPGDAWSSFLATPPPPQYTTLQAMIMAVPGVKVSGNAVKWVQAAAAVERVFSLAHSPIPRASRTRTVNMGGISGKYVEVDTSTGRHLIYYEESGRGRPLVLLHTAGADSRQYHALLADPTLQNEWHMFAFDLPWHGNSPPPDGWWKTPYQLTAKEYIEDILAFLQATNLDDKRPVILGCSMAGAIVLILASQYGAMFGGAISCEAGFNTAGRSTPWAYDPQVNSYQFIRTWVGGMMAPTGPEESYHMALWHYGQGGPGVYSGDLAFYSQEWPRIQTALQPTQCPLWIMVGDYDYSCSKEASCEVAKKMGGHFVPMKFIGHFPMVENAERFIDYLTPILQQLYINRGGKQR